MKIKTLAWLLMITGLTVVSCAKTDTEKVSAHGTNKSHNEGLDCLSCHTKGGSGETRFNIAGTVYDSLFTNPYPNTTIKLFTGPSGSGKLKATVEVDAKGNFYTTQHVNWGTGLYPTVEGDFLKKYMSAPILAGNCNSCHGVSTDHIWTK